MDEEKEATRQFWKSIEDNVPFEFNFSPAYLTNSIEKFKKHGWKISDQN